MLCVLDLGALPGAILNVALSMVSAPLFNLFFLLKILHFYHVYLHVCVCIHVNVCYMSTGTHRPEEVTGGPSVAVTGSLMRMLGIELWSS